MALVKELEHHVACDVVCFPPYSMPQLPAKTVTVTAASPKILESHFKEGNMIVIIFDRDVESSSGDCTEIFDQDTIQVIGKCLFTPEEFGHLLL